MLWSVVLLFWLICAVLLFWAVGAYNRLVRLRAAVRKAFATLDELLLRQVVWVQGCLPPSLRGGEVSSAEAAAGEPTASTSEPSPETMVIWGRLAAASEQFSVALAHLRAQPLDGVAAGSVGLSHAMLLGAWDQAMAEAIMPGTEPSAEQLNARWMTLQHQTLPPQDAFNLAVQDYNVAVRQFPAILLAKLFGFKQAGPLDRLGPPTVSGSLEPPL